MHEAAVFPPMGSSSSGHRNVTAKLFANYLRTAALMAGLVALLAAVGHVVGGAKGAMVFGGLGLVMNAVNYWFSDRIALHAHGARPVSPREAPGLYQMLERLSRRAHMPTPRLYIIPSHHPNAFATGRSPAHAAVAVTEGLLDILPRRQLEAVLAHELAHIKNRDVLVATLAAGVAGLISSLGYALQWGLAVGTARDGDEESNSGFSGLIWLLLAPFVALLIQMAISRTREYGADAGGAALTGDPEALAEALETLDQGSRVLTYDKAGPATAHFFIVPPLRGSAAQLMELFSTHPPIRDRVRRLRQMRVSRS